MLKRFIIETKSIGASFLRLAIEEMGTISREKSQRQQENMDKIHVLIINRNPPLFMTTKG